MSLVLLLGSVVLMALPLGAVLAPSPTERIERTFSCLILVSSACRAALSLSHSPVSGAAVLVTLWNLLGKEGSPSSADWPDGC